MKCGEKGSKRFKISQRGKPTAITSASDNIIFYSLQAATPEHNWNKENPR